MCLPLDVEVNNGLLVGWFTFGLAKKIRKHRFGFTWLTNLTLALICILSLRVEYGIEQNVESLPAII